MKRVLFLIAILACTIATANAVCEIKYNGSSNNQKLADPIFDMLHQAKTCPAEVLSFRRLLLDAGLTLQPTMVANRGYHNPSEGSFSLFEMVSGALDGKPAIKPGDVFFGHFITATTHHQLILDQSPHKNALMIEAFAWDESKQVYNFYELRGNGTQGDWYYRGDSIDIMDDNIQLHRQSDPAHPVFGDRLRCSACHVAGGPIMKELQSPHNDWWEPVRKLDLGDNVPDHTLASIMQSLVPADKLTHSVIAGIKQLENSPAIATHRQTHSLQEILRPLFCPMELNLASDTSPNEANHPTIHIPTAFFIDPHFIEKGSIDISRENYTASLLTYHSHFPETTLDDADHAWLTPVKAHSDETAMDQLIQQGIIDEKFAYDVLSIDMTNPLFSTSRCQLLRYVPDEMSAGKNWQDKFKNNLAQSNNPDAKKLLSNMNNPALTKAAYRERAKHFIAKCQEKLSSQQSVITLYALLIQRRKEVLQSEISKNPRGQILEPGFRVIFPEANTDIKPGQYTLTEDCDVVEQF